MQREISGADFIDVQFRGGDVYRYTYASAGEWNVENMKTCAYNGFGLNGYIMRNCKYGYASKHKGGAPPDIRTSIPFILKKYLPEIKPFDSYGDQGWFEQVYQYDLDVVGHIIELHIYVRVDFFEDGTLCGSMRFTCPYKKSAWEREKLSSTSLFNVKESFIERNKLAFLYKDVFHRSDYVMVLNQFAADLECNLSGRYVIMIGRLNELIQ